MKELHFSIGENLGEILFQIACEHIQKGNVEKAISTYTDSLIGFSEEYVKNLLKNECVLKTNTEKDSLEISTNVEDIEKNKKNVIDWHRVLNDKVGHLSEIISSIYDAKNYLSSRCADPVNFNIRNLGVEYEAQINIAAKLIAGKKFANLHSNGENVWEELVLNCESDNATRAESILYNIVKYVSSIRQLYGYFFETLNYYNAIKHFELIDRYSFIELSFERCLTLLEEFCDDNKGYYHPMCDEQIHNLKEQIHEDICKTEIGRTFIINGILPKNPIDYYDAAWISPEGKFYGAIGETNEMLHLNLAYQICEKIDGVDMLEADRYLTDKSWIKVHHNEAYVYLAYDKKSAQEDGKLYTPTKEQIKVLCEYMDAHFNGKFYTEFAGLGSRISHPDPYSTRNIKQMDEIALHNAFKF